MERAAVPILRLSILILDGSDYGFRFGPGLAKQHRQQATFSRDDCLSVDKDIELTAAAGFKRGLDAQSFCNRRSVTRYF